MCRRFIHLLTVFMLGLRGDPAVATGQLTINGQKMSTSENCNVSVEEALTLEVGCPGLVTSCLIDVYVNDSTVVNQSRNHAVFTETYNVGSLLRLTVDFPGLDKNGTNTNISCLVQTGPKPQSQECKSTHIYLVALIIPFSLIAFRLTFLWIHIARRKKLKQEASVLLKETRDLKSS
ncbi:unnamed protein product [Lymnaea stagnalis]|uniref:Uncharacterized protein n=1 Tax=Lymnaea stagnalis TaxID=6523 RepID=A0AAV2IBT0_LYMST